MTGPRSPETAPDTTLCAKPFCGHGKDRHVIYMTEGRYGCAECFNRDISEDWCRGFRAPAVSPEDAPPETPIDEERLKEWLSVLDASANAISAVANEWPGSRHADNETRNIARLDSLRAALPALAASSSEVKRLEAIEAQFTLLKQAVNSSTDECLPGCSRLGHEGDCPSCNPSRWLIDQQKEINAVQSAVKRLTEELTRTTVELDAANWRANLPMQQRLASLRSAVEALPRYRMSALTMQQTSAGKYLERSAVLDLLRPTNSTDT